MDQTRHDPDAAMFDSDDLVEPPRWPKVVGVISIVWGALGITCGICGLAGQQMGAAFYNPQMASQQPPPAPMTAFTLGSQIAGFLNAVLLLVAGILLVGRKPVSKTLHLFYGLISLPLFAMTVYFMMQEQARLAEWMRQNPDAQYTKMMQGPMAGSMFIVMFAVVGVLGLAYPLFCLLWFGAIKRRAPLDVPREEII